MGGGGTLVRESSTEEEKKNKLMYEYRIKIHEKCLMPNLCLYFDG